MPGLAATSHKSRATTCLISMRPRLRWLVHDVVELLVTEHGYTLASGRPKKANGNGHATSSGSFDDLC